jgi:hypothetical protein
MELLNKCLFGYGILNTKEMAGIGKGESEAILFTPGAVEQAGCRLDLSGKAVDPVDETSQNCSRA